MEDVAYEVDKASIPGGDCILHLVPLIQMSSVH